MQKVIVHEKRLVVNDYFKVEEATFSVENADGCMGTPNRRIVLDRGDSVAAVIVDVERKKLILTKQFRYPTFEKGPGWMTEIVAGVIENAESPEEAVQSEILEEIGYHTNYLRKIGMFYLSPGGSSERLFLFYAEVQPEDRVPECERPRDPEEDIAIVEVPLTDLHKYHAMGSFSDAKTIIGVTWLTQYIASQESTHSNPAH